MNTQQHACFEAIYNFVHDESLNCANLMGYVDMSFPDPEQGAFAQALHRAVKPYLQARLDLAEAIMLLIRQLSADIEADKG